MVVPFAAGAGGMVGSARVAKAAPDGYQFVLGSRADASHQSLYKKPLYNLVTDLAPAVLIANQATVLVASEIAKNAGPIKAAGISMDRSAGGGRPSGESRRA